MLACKDAQIININKEVGLLKRVIRRNIHLGNLCHKNIHREGKSGLFKFFMLGNTTGVKILIETVLIMWLSQPGKTLGSKSQDIPRAQFRDCYN